MCTPIVIDHVRTSMSPADAGRASGTPVVHPPRSTVCFSQVIDLTHPLPPDFPSASGDTWLELENVRNYAETGINFKRWHIYEHIGTHIDAPIHFAEKGDTVDQIPVESLVVPLAVIDIAARAVEDPDTELTPEDIRAWENVYGDLPEGCCVAVNAGWDQYATGLGYRNADQNGTKHFPGVHPDSCQMLLEERVVTGIGVDTLSIDHGPSSDFPAHKRWLPAGRWALEGLANLGKLPPVGATIVVGSPTIVGATGGPSRILALL